MESDRAPKSGPPKGQTEGAARGESLRSKGQQRSRWRPVASPAKTTLGALKCPIPSLFRLIVSSRRPQHATTPSRLRFWKTPRSSRPGTSVSMPPTSVTCSTRSANSHASRSWMGSCPRASLAVTRCNSRRPFRRRLRWRNSRQSRPVIEFSKALSARATTAPTRPESSFETSSRIPPGIRPTRPIRPRSARAEWRPSSTSRRWSAN